MSLQIQHMVVEHRPVPWKRTTHTSTRAGKIRRRNRADYAAFKNVIAWSARAARLRKFEGDVGVMIVFYSADGRVADLDNLTKAICDGLQGIAFEDDRQVCEQIVRREIDRERPRVEFYLWSVSEGVSKIWNASEQALRVECGEES